MKDPCIRKLLKDIELKHFLEDQNSIVVDELNLPATKARIDIAVVNGHFHGYEIKSASDTLQRLPSQLEAYEKVFDYLSVVTEKKYHEKIVQITPPWVGIILCSEKNGLKSIKQIRKAKLNKNKQGFYLAKMLWRDEIIDILTENKIQFRKKDRNWLLCETLTSSFDTKTISRIVREKLKNRCDWKTDTK